MAPIYREPLDYTYGTLSVAAAIGDTTLTSTAFTSLPNSTYSTVVVLPIVLHNPATGVREMVWVTAHTGSANTVTVIRGKEGTSAAAWPSGTQWIVAPTIARDGLGAYSSAALAAMTDAHVGQRALQGDTGMVVTNTYNGGWVADAGLCLPSEVQKTAANATVPTPATILTRMGNVVSAAPSAGIVAVTFPVAFPNGVIGGVSGSTWSAQFEGIVTVDSLSTTGMQLKPKTLAGATPNPCSLFWVVWGW